MLAIKRAFDKSLFDNMIAATSRASGQQALVDGLNALEVTIGDPEHDRSPAALVGALNDALQLYSTTPNDLSLAQSAVNRANDLARALNEASDAVQGVRRQADKDMAASVDQLNSLLADFQSVNGEIVVGTHAGADVTDKLDQRDRLVSQISEIIGVTMVTRGDNDAVLYTDSGVTLFETVARSVTFTPTPGLGRGAAGECCIRRWRAGHRQRRGDADQVRQPVWPCDTPRRGRRHLSEPARRDCAKPHPGLRGIRPERAADAARCARALHLAGRAGDAGRLLGAGARRLDRGQRQCRSRARRQRGPVEGRRNIGPWQPGIRLQYHQCCRLFGSAERTSRQPRGAADLRRRRRHCRLRQPGYVLRLLGQLARSRTEGCDQRRRLFRDAGGACLRCAVKRHRRQSRRRDEPAPRPGEVLPGFVQAPGGHRQHARRHYSPGSASDEDDLRLDARRGERNAPLGDGDAVRAGEAAEGDHKRAGGGYRARSRRAYRPHGRVPPARAPAWRR